jgi:2-polyprenyl-3-methyl-5-hydroxy-6-metoxy-1,4-benzoquinol methylase
MTKNLGRDELMARVLEAVPEACSYLEPHHERIHTTYSFLRAHLPAGLTSAVDVGASFGIFLPVLDALGLRELHAIDYAEQPASRPLPLTVGGRRLQATQHLCDIERHAFPFADGALDLVVFMEAIEHLAADPMHTLLECNRSLRIGGSLLVSTPNACSGEALIRLLRGQHPGHFTPYRNRSDHRHHREYAPAELAKLVDCAGFEITAMATLPVARTTVRWLVRALRWARRARIADDLLGDLTYVFAKKVRDVAAATLPLAQRYPPPVYLRDPVA